MELLFHTRLFSASIFLFHSAIACTSTHPSCGIVSLSSVSIRICISLSRKSLPVHVEKINSEFSVSITERIGGQGGILKPRISTHVYLFNKKREKYRVKREKTSFKTNPPIASAPHSLPKHPFLRFGAYNGS